MLSRLTPPPPPNLPNLPDLPFIIAAVPVNLRLITSSYLDTRIYLRSPAATVSPGSWLRSDVDCIYSCMFVLLCVLGRVGFLVGCS